MMPGPRLAILTSQFPELHETFILREVLELQRRGYDVSVFSLKPCRDAIIHPEARPLMAQTVYAPFFWSWRLWGALGYWLVRRPLRLEAVFWRMVWTHRHAPDQLCKLLALWPKLLLFARLIRRRGLRHIHAHWATVPAGAAMVIAELTDADWSLTAHAWDIFVRNPTLKAKLRSARFVLTCTDYNRRHLAALVPDAAPKILLAYHGVRLDEKARTRTDVRPGTSAAEHKSAHVPLLLSVGRLVETKGWFTLLAALAQLRQARAAFRAILVGQGPLRGPLIAQLQHLGLSEAVTLVGALPKHEVQALYAQAAVFALPSEIAVNGDRDGIPNVIFEAMAAGLPVVSTTISGIPEAVVSEETGLLVPPRNPAALAVALQRLLQDPAKAQRFGRAGRARVQAAFDERRHMQQLDETLRAQLRDGGCPRILYVIWSLAVGGAERVVTLLAGHLPRDRFAAHVACLDAPGALAPMLQQQGLPVVTLHKRGPLDVTAWWRLVRYLREARIDVVHTHLWGANFWGRLAGWYAGRPVVVTEHSTDTWKPWWFFVLDRWLTQGTARFVAVSEAVRQFYVQRGVRAGLTQTIVNGIDTAQFPALARSALYAQLQWPAETPVLLAVGRLVGAKRFDVFIDLMAEVIRDRPHTRALIVGEGRLRGALEERIRRQHLSGKVVLAGLREDVAALLRGARAVVFTSEREGLPMVLIEAMASGVPVVSTAVGGIPEVLADGRTGWLVPPDQIAAMHPRLLALIDQPALAAQVGQAAQEAASTHWSVAAMVAQHAALYDSLLRPRRRVVHIIDHLDPGGAQSQLLALARHLPRATWACRVVCLSTERTRLVPQFEAAGVPVTCLPQSGKWSWTCFRQLARLLRTERPALVQTWLFTADLYGRLAARCSRVPVVITAVRSVEPTKPGHYVAVDALLQHWTDAVTINAEAIRPVITVRDRIRPRKIHTIYNGIDLAVFAPATANGTAAHNAAAAPVVGLISRLMPEKDPETFVRAALRVATQVPQARFLIVGDGPLQGPLEALVREAGQAARVRFAGYQQDRAAWLRQMDVIALSSLYEGCANAILEAMAMGKPVVATRVGGNPELVIEGETGLLVPSRDPAAMAQALLTLLRDPARAARMGAAGRRRVETDFTIDRMVAQTTALYETLLHQKE